MYGDVVQLGRLRAAWALLLVQRYLSLSLSLSLSLYVCMYVCMHAYMHACMYVCMYVCMCVCISISLTLSLSIYIYIYRDVVQLSCLRVTAQAIFKSCRRMVSVLLNVCDDCMLMSRLVCYYVIML